MVWGTVASSRVRYSSLQRTTSPDRKTSVPCRMVSYKQNPKDHGSVLLRRTPQKMGCLSPSDIVFAVNTSRHDSTGYSPAFLNLAENWMLRQHFIEQRAITFRYPKMWTTKVILNTCASSLMRMNWFASIWEEPFPYKAGIIISVVGSGGIM